MAHLELLAELDSLSDSLERWVADAPEWQPARTCRALVRRLLERGRSMRVRLEAPLVVATLGGTGTGKSALVNALVGAHVTRTDRARPTTLLPVMICRPGITPKMLGIDPQLVELVQRDLPALGDMVIIDCPDPDTSEQADAPRSNLARLRQILPHCDVLLVATTQQKYRSARVAEELAGAAPGARLVFVQTHADEDQDIREDWRRILQEQYTVGHIFLVDSLAALNDAQAGVGPRGEFAKLVDLLTRQLAGTAPARIRRANFLDLVADTLAACKSRFDEGLPAVRQLETAVDEQRSSLAARLAEQTRSELLAGRRQWEGRLVNKVAAHWGFSPFALVLRAFGSVGGVVSGALLMRVRTPAQLALWGALEAGRTLHRKKSERQADASADRALAGTWDQAGLHAASLVLTGYATEAGLDRNHAAVEVVTAEAAEAGRDFATDVAGELEVLLDRVARQHTGWFTRWRYDILLTAMLVVILFRPAKNFFYDSWLAAQPVEVFGVEFYLLSAFWFLLWCVVLLWVFTTRLRRGLGREIESLSEGWKNPRPAAGIFARLEGECGRVEHFGRELERLQQHVATLRHRLDLPDDQLAHRR